MTSMSGKPQQRHKHPVYTIKIVKPLVLWSRPSSTDLIMPSRLASVCVPAPEAASCRQAALAQARRNLFALLIYSIASLRNFRTLVPDLHAQFGFHEALCSCI
ncbi:hypothetical protein ABBQ38_010030 [Trebouxia sp. C0009 RCD-2024]